MKKMLVPTVRFPEFRDAGEWNSKSLNQITTAIFDGTHQTPTYTEDGIPFFSVENIVSGKLNKFISKADYLAATNKNKPEKCDVLVTRIGNIGYSTVVDWDYEFSIYVTLAVVKKDDRFNSNYLHSFMQSELYQTEIRSKSLLNAVPCKINMDELRKTKVLLPAPKEQQKIADCLSSIDELINAQGQKIEALKTHKKSLMQQLFPHEGETIPRLRFPEFRDAGEWGNFHLSDFVRTLDAGVSVNSGDRPAVSREAGILKTSAVTNGIFEPLENKVVLDEIEVQRLKEPVCEGTIIISRMNTPLLVGANAYVEKSLSNIFLPDRLWAAKPNPDTSMRFIACILGSEKGRSALCELASGSSGTMKNITKPDVLALQISAPTFLEQQEIASCLTSIDDLINAHSQKLATLKIHKKGLMQALFPAADEVSA